MVKQKLIVNECKLDLYIRSDFYFNDSFLIVIYVFVDLIIMLQVYNSKFFCSISGFIFITRCVKDCGILYLIIRKCRASQASGNPKRCTVGNLFIITGSANSNNDPPVRVKLYCLVISVNNKFRHCMSS